MEVKKHWASLAFSLFLVVFTSCTAWAMDLQESSRTWSASLELGSTFQGSGAVRMVGAWWLPKELAIGKHGTGSARLELDLGVLDSRDTTIDAGFQPVFRYTLRKFQVMPYIDAGAGIHFLSRANIRGRQMGAAFQFSLLTGAGLNFNDKVELGYRFLHISNADIHNHNNGRDEHLLVLTMPF